MPAERAIQVIRWIERIEAGQHLSDVERRALLEGNFPLLAYDPRQPIPVEVDLEFTVTSRVSVRINRRHRTRQGWIAFDYTVVDNRDRYLRRRLPAGRVERDDVGEPVEPTPHEIAKAAEASAYDGNVRDPLDAGLAVEQDVQAQFTRQARQRFASHLDTDLRERRAEERSRQAAAVIRDTAVMLVRAGEDPVPFLAEVQRLASRTQDEHRDAAAAA